ncbi:hypothetical protein MHBO_001983 [Bonamia ostreae]|uniref:Uncharacterized protein n=1 Tax=Bonamia ostreae TaxID=126728 RepID=A0ABV2AKV0_9EUKA
MISYARTCSWPPGDITFAIRGITLRQADSLADDKTCQCLHLHLVIENNIYILKLHMEVGSNKTQFVELVKHTHQE